MPPDDLSDKFRRWAFLRGQSDITSAQMNKLRDELMAHAAAQGDHDERGNSHLSLAIEVGGKSFSGIKREARTSTTLNKERALEMAYTKGLQDELIVHEPCIDTDALYAAWQRGKITERELDGLFDTKTTFAFKAVSS